MPGVNHLTGENEGEFSWDVVAPTGSTDAVVKYSVSDATWCEGIDYDGDGTNRPFKIAKTGPLGTGDVLSFEGTTGQTMRLPAVSVPFTRSFLAIDSGTNAVSAARPGVLLGGIDNNTAIGVNSLFAPSVGVGTNNSCFGTNAGFNVTTGTQNVFVGDFSGNNTQAGTRNTSMGSNSGPGASAASSFGTYVGYKAGNATTVDDNTFIGFRAGQVSTTGVQNVCVGSQCGVNIIGGANNTLVGYGAASSSTGGLYRMALGHGASSNTNNHCTLGGTGVSALVAVKPGAVGCDLGTTALPFQNCVLNGGLTFPKPFGEMYSTVGLVTSTLVNGSWAVAPFTTTVNNASNQSFTHTNPNKLTYTGTATKNFHAGVTIAGFPDSNLDQNWEFGLLVNSTLVPGSVVSMTSTNIADRYSTAIHKILELETNDFVQLGIKRETGSVEWTTEYMNLFLIALPNAV